MITKEAIEAAKKAAPQFWRYTDNFERNVSKIITAAIAAMPGPAVSDVGQEVKQNYNCACIHPSQCDNSCLTPAPDLASENERLMKALRNAPDVRHFQILAEAMAEVKATNDGQSDQTITEIVDGCLAEIAALEDHT